MLQFNDWLSQRKTHALPSDIETVMSIWAEHRRPYYNVFPTIVPSLIRVKLAVPSNMLELPCPALLIRLPKGQDRNVLWPVRCILVCKVFGSNSSGIFIAYLLEGDEIVGLTIAQGDALIEDVLTSSPTVGTADHLAVDSERNAVRLVLALCMIGDDPELIEPDVLKVDREAWAESHDPQLMKAAHSKGKVGWNIGSNVDVVPHIRQPHLAVRWLRIPGVKELQPRLRKVRGCVVKREQIVEVPHGYLDDCAPRHVIYPLALRLLRKTYCAEYCCALCSIYLRG